MNNNIGRKLLTFNINNRGNNLDVRKPKNQIKAKKKAENHLPGAHLIVSRSLKARKTFERIPGILLLSASLSSSASVGTIAKHERKILWQNVRIERKIICLCLGIGNCFFCNL